MSKKTKVKNTSIIKLKHFDDYPDGSLIIGEAKKTVPFEIKRVYYITNLASPQAIRGKHAHKKLEQIIFCVKGSFILTLDDGRKKQKIKMNKPHIGIKMGRFVWLEMTGFSEDCAILVLANDYYKESDYIRVYDEFLKLTKQKTKSK